MICLRCDNEEFRENQFAIIEQVYKGKQLVVTSPAMFCVKCGYTTVTLEQADVLRKKTEQAYSTACKKEYALNHPQLFEPFMDKWGIAKLLGKTTRTVDTYMRLKAIPFYKVGRTVMFKWSEVDKAIKSYNK